MIEKARQRVKDPNRPWGHRLQWYSTPEVRGWRDLAEDAYEKIAGEEHSARLAGKKKADGKHSSHSTKSSSNGNDQKNEQGGGGKKADNKGKKGQAAKDGKNGFHPRVTGMPVNKSNAKVCAVPGCNTPLSDAHKYVTKCAKFLSLSSKEAYDWFKECGAQCKICFSTLHPMNFCTINFKCLVKWKAGPNKGQVCNGKHNHKLHFEKPYKNSSSATTSSNAAANEAEDEEEQA